MLQRQWRCHLWQWSLSQYFCIALARCHSYCDTVSPLTVVIVTTFLLPCQLMLKTCPLYSAQVSYDGQIQFQNILCSGKSSELSYRDSRYSRDVKLTLTILFSLKSITLFETWEFFILLLIFLPPVPVYIKVEKIHRINWCSFIVSETVKLNWK